MPRSHRQPPPAPRAPAANAAEPKSDGVLAMTFKIFLLFAGLMVKVPVGLYFSCKLLLFQSLMLMSPEDSAFYATIVSVVGLHVQQFSECTSLTLRTEMWKCCCCCLTLPTMWPIMMTKLIK
uniref:Inositol polyphosphate-5-phosphatase F n=1 Tax=Mus musculus TaxID=10090 RepID=A0A0J9YU13_MOUSE